MKMVKDGKRVSIVVMALLVVYLVWPTGDAPEQKISTLTLYLTALIAGVQAVLAAWSKISAMLDDRE